MRPSSDEPAAAQRACFAGERVSEPRVDTAVVTATTLLTVTVVLDSREASDEELRTGDFQTP